jgi:hypothetical protein
LRKNVYTVWDECRTRRGGVKDGVGRGEGNVSEGVEGAGVENRIYAQKRIFALGLKNSLIRFNSNKVNKTGFFALQQIKICNNRCEPDMTGAYFFHPVLRSVANFVK